MLGPSKFRVKCRGEAQDGTTGPAPAVIPALIAYVKVVAVKTLVVGIRSSEATRRTSGQLPFRGTRGAFAGGRALAKRASDCPFTGHRAILPRGGFVRSDEPLTMIKPEGSMRVIRQVRSSMV